MSHRLLVGSSDENAGLPALVFYSFHYACKREGQEKPSALGTRAGREVPGGERWAGETAENHRFRL